MQRLRFAVFFAFCFSISALHALQDTGVFFVTVVNTTDTQEEDRLVNALTKAGFTCIPAPDPSGNGIIHVQVGPFTSQSEVDSARSRLVAAGYKLPGEVTGTPGGISAEQASLEAQALAKMGGGTAPATPATGSDLEAQALAHLGGTPSSPPATGADLEAQALQSMKTNEVKAERERQLALQREQEEQAEQAEQAREAAEAQQAALAQSSSSGSGGFLNALNGALGAVNNGLDAQIAQRNAQNAELQARMDAQVAANNARREEAERQREAAAAQRQLAEQNRQAQQQQAVSSGSAANSRLCNSAQSSASLIAQGCAGVSSNVSAQSRTAQQPTQVAASASPNKSDFTYIPTPNPNQNPGGVPSGVNTGTAAPASCVYLSQAQPCVPLAQYAQMQAQQQAAGAGICPPSGFVPPVMHQTGDVSIGIEVPCKPGTPYGPLIATTSNGGYTGVTPPDPVSVGGTSASSTGGSGGGGSSDPNLNKCIYLSYKQDPITGSHLIIQNNCLVSASVHFYASSQVYGAVDLNPGAADNTYQGEGEIAAAGGVSIYACPIGDVPRQADGSPAYNGVSNHFECSRK